MSVLTDRKPDKLPPMNPQWIRRCYGLVKLMLPRSTRLSGTSAIAAKPAVYAAGGRRLSKKQKLSADV